MSEVKDDEQKTYEERLRRRLKLLENEFKEGKIQITSDIFEEFTKSLKAIRTSKDGQIDLNTVDPIVRSMALVVEGINEREKLKQLVSLSDIQQEYFKYIEKQFSGYYEIMNQKKLYPHDVAMSLIQHEDFIKEANKNLDKLLETIYDFWEKVYDIAAIHIQDLHKNIKGVFGGDLFPSAHENIVSKCGIYIDTIVLPDPFVRSKFMFQNSSDKDRVYYLIKHGLNMLQYKELALADLDQPIVAILPDMAQLHDDELDFVHALAEKDALTHSSKLFGREFETFEILLDFAKRLDTPQQVAKEIKDHTRILFNIEWKGDIIEQINKAITGEPGKIMRTKHPGIITATQPIGRLIVSNDLLLKSRRLNGTPIIDAPTSWQYFVWKMEYDAESIEKRDNLSDLHVVRGLQNLADGEMQWLGKVPSDALIEIRKQGAMEEIRNILGQGIEDLTTIKPHNFHRSQDKVFDNIYEAFQNHSNNIKKLQSKKWKFVGKDIGSWLVTGTLAVTAAITGNHVWALTALGAKELIHSPKLIDIPKTIKQLAKESNDLKLSPVGILFDISKKYNG